MYRSKITNEAQDNRQLGRRPEPFTTNRGPMTTDDMRRHLECVVNKLEQTKEGPCGPGSDLYEDAKDLAYNLMVLLDRISDLGSLRDNQVGNAQCDNYHHGLANGIILCEAVMKNEEARYISRGFETLVRED